MMMMMIERCEGGVALTANRRNGDEGAVRVAGVCYVEEYVNREAAREGEVEHWSSARYARGSTSNKMKQTVIIIIIVMMSYMTFFSEICRAPMMMMMKRTIRKRVRKKTCLIQAIIVVVQVAQKERLRKNGEM